MLSCLDIYKQTIIMRKIIFIVVSTVLFAGKSFAQDSIPSVENCIKGIQIGESGLVFNYEFKLTNKFALRTEAGMTLAFFSGDDNWWTGEKQKGSLAALPTFTIEPRFYYNLSRRIRKGKDISRNRANYFSLFANYSGGWGAIKFDNRIDRVPDFIAVVPTWGMRRTLGEQFNYELGAGIGYLHESKFDHFNHTHKSEEEAILFIRARFGFDF
jgi:hypothetical protein